MKKTVLVKVCDICSREFETLWKFKKYCSLRCVNEKGRIYQKERVSRLRVLEEENEELRKQLQGIEK